MGRTREQQDRHNENRRNMMKEARKSIFAMKYIKIKHPETYNEACNLYAFMNELYPSRRDLTKTQEFVKCTENGIVRNTILQPQLRIPLMPTRSLPATTSEAIPSQPVETQEISPQTVETQEIPFNYDATDEEIQTMLAELRQDPELGSIFDDFRLLETTVRTEVNTLKTTVRTEVNTVETTAFSSEIDQIIRDEFMALGEDLPDIYDNQDELFQ